MLRGRCSGLTARRPGGGRNEDPDWSVIVVVLTLGDPNLSESTEPLRWEAWAFSFDSLFLGFDLQSVSCVSFVVLVASVTSMTGDFEGGPFSETISDKPGLMQ